VGTVIDNSGQDIVPRGIDFKALKLDLVIRIRGQDLIIQSRAGKNAQNHQTKREVLAKI